MQMCLIRCFLLCLLIFQSPIMYAQDIPDSLKGAYDLAKIRNLENRLELLESQIKILERTELVQSMCQRSLITPDYLGDLRPLLARQAYNFWIGNSGEKYVSHLTVYSALYYANKQLGFDEVNYTAFNQIMGHSKSVTSIQFGAQPNIYYSSGSDGRVLRWDLNDKNKIPTVVYEGAEPIRSIDVSYKDKYLLIVTRDRGVVLIDLNGFLGEDAKMMRDPEPVMSAIFLPRRQAYVTINNKGELRVKGYKADTTMLGRTSSRVLAMAVNPENDRIFAGTEDGSLKMWDSSENSTHHFKEPYAVNALSISSDYKHLVLGREKGDVVVWDLHKNEIQRIINVHQSAISDVDISPDNSLLLTASRDGTTRVWDLQDTKKMPVILDDHNDWVMTASFDPSGTQIVTGSRDSYIRTWPVDPLMLADRICEFVTRNLTPEEWVEYVGEDIPYQKTCPSIE